MFKKFILKALYIKKHLNNQIWLLTRQGIENKRRLAKFFNKYKGHRCFVMGNGPSLLKCNLKLLKNEITIASNAQYLIWDKMGFIPTFLTVEDQLVAEDRRHEFNALKNTTKIFPLDLSDYFQFDENTIFINFKRKYHPFPKFSLHLQHKAYWGGTVSYFNLQLAYYLGCNEIYLVGFDNEYKVPEKMTNHVITSEEEDINHIHPDYFGKGYRWHDPNLRRMETSYQVARKILESKNIKVFNATIGGKLEIFNRINYNSLFSPPL